MNNSNFYSLPVQDMDLVDIDKVLDDFELNEDNNEYNDKSSNIIKNSTIKINNSEKLSAIERNSEKQNDGMFDIDNIRKF